MYRKQKFAPACFLIYTAAMCVLLFARPRDTGLPYWQLVASKINLIPLHTVRLYLNSAHNPDFTRRAVINLAGNIVLFIPLGLLLPAVFPSLRSILKVAAATAAAIAVVELVQLFTLVGSCDIDDLLLNLIGALIGYGIYRFLCLICKK